MLVRYNSKISEFGFNLRGGFVAGGVLLDADANKECIKKGRKKLYILYGFSNLFRDRKLQLIYQ